MGDVALDMDDVEAGYVAHGLAHGRLLDLVEAGRPGHERLGVVVGVLAVDGGHGVPISAVRLRRVNRQVKGEIKGKAGRSASATRMRSGGRRRRRGRAPSASAWNPAAS